MKIELSLSVPANMAGIRTATVINVGMPALAFVIGVFDQRYLRSKGV